LPHVSFTPLLSRFFPDICAGEVAGETVRELLTALEQTYPGLGNYLTDDQGALRQHVQIFLDSEQIVDRRKQSDAVDSQSRIFIFQALSGG